MKETDRLKGIIAALVLVGLILCAAFYGLGHYQGSVKGYCFGKEAERDFPQCEVGIGPNTCKMNITYKLNCDEHHSY